MIRSMTGFGYYESCTDEKKITVQIRSVNHRYLDLNIRMSKKLNFLESKIRTLLKQYISRGKVDLFLYYEDFTISTVSVKYNEAIAGQYLSYIQELADEFHLEDDIRVSTLSRYPEVFALEEQSLDEESVWEDLQRAIRAACESFVQARETEGESLKRDIDGKLAVMLTDVERIEERAPFIVNEYREKLFKQAAELFENHTVDESRLVTEVVLFADKICTDEETVRLKSHIRSMQKEIAQGGEVGRKLDFIAQEMNREANTILSKANDLKTSDIAIDLKTAIEKIREQVQNIE